MTPESQVTEGLWRLYKVCGGQNLRIMLCDDEKIMKIPEVVLIHSWQPFTVLREQECMCNQDKLLVSLLIS